MGPVIGSCLNLVFFTWSFLTWNAEVFALTTSVSFVVAALGLHRFLA